MTRIGNLGRLIYVMLRNYVRSMPQSSKITRVTCVLESKCASFKFQNIVSILLFQVSKIYDYYNYYYATVLLVIVYDQKVI